MILPDTWVVAYRRRENQLLITSNPAQGSKELCKRDWQCCTRMWCIALIHLARTTYDGNPQCYSFSKRGRSCRPRGYPFNLFSSGSVLGSFLRSQLWYLTLCEFSGRVAEFSMICGDPGVFWSVAFCHGLSQIFARFSAFFDSPASVRS